MPVYRQGQRFTNRSALIDKLDMMRKNPEQYTEVEVEERKVWSEDDTKQAIWVEHLRRVNGLSKGRRLHDEA